MPGEQGGNGIGGDIVIKDGLTNTGLRWLFNQDKMTILLVLILGGVGTGVYFIGTGLYHDIPEWLASMRSGYREAITEFRAEVKEQRDLHDKQMRDMKDTFEKVHAQSRAEYQSLVEQMFKFRVENSNSVSIGTDENKRFAEWLTNKKGPPPTSKSAEEQPHVLQP